MPIICNYGNCRNRASYALTYGKPDRCKEHKEGRRGQFDVCKCGKASCTYNEPGETRAICCSQCKTETMVNVKSKRCKCGKAIPNFNEPGETKAICCGQCKTETMVDVAHKRCVCGKSTPNFNEPGKTKAICCSVCKTDTMIDVLCKRCKCGKSVPLYNNPGKTDGICCSQCKTETMVDVKSKRCKCGKATPNFNEPGIRTPICCIECKTETMIDVCHKRCKSEFCDTRISNKYKGYCSHCFQHLFPNDPLTLQFRYKTKEIAVRDFINANFKGWQHDKCLYTGNCDCTHRRRIDHRVLVGNTLLVVETDENQHKGYDEMDEEVRYDDLFMVHGGKWIYIRFNPDKYKSKNGKNKNPEIATRLFALQKQIETQLARISNEENTEILERHYMYYDNYS